MFIVTLFSFSCLLVDYLNFFRVPLWFIFNFFSVSLHIIFSLVAVTITVYIRKSSLVSVFLWLQVIYRNLISFSFFYSSHLKNLIVLSFSSVYTSEGVINFAYFCFNHKIWLKKFMRWISVMFTFTFTHSAVLFSFLEVLAFYCNFFLFFLLWEFLLAIL